MFVCLCNGKCPDTDIHTLSHTHACVVICPSLNAERMWRPKRASSPTSRSGPWSSALVWSALNATSKRSVCIIPLSTWTRTSVRVLEYQVALRVATPSVFLLCHFLSYYAVQPLYVCRILDGMCLCTLTFVTHTKHSSPTQASQGLLYVLEQAHNRTSGYFEYICVHVTCLHTGFYLHCDCFVLHARLHGCQCRLYRRSEIVWLLRAYRYCFVCQQTRPACT